MFQPVRKQAMCLCLAMFTALLSGSRACAGDVTRYDVMWDSPSADSLASMPLGNGDISINAWVEQSGDLQFYIGKTDSWGEHGRLLKVGKVRVTLDPQVSVQHFKQQLRLRDGTMVVSIGEGEEAVELRLWVDANHPVVRVEVLSAIERTATASIELWRTARAAIPNADVSDTFEDRSKPNRLHRDVFVEADVIIPKLNNRIGWYHHASAKSDYAELVKIQGLAEYYEDKPDPLLDRVFGAIVTARGGERLDGTHLLSRRSREHQFGVHVITMHPSSPERWMDAAVSLIEQTEMASFAASRTAHEQWWQKFWDRSWIDVTAAEKTPRRIVPENTHPVRIGIDQQGQNRFVGEIGRVTILPWWLTANQITELSAVGRVGAVTFTDKPLYTRAGMIGEAIEDSSTWQFDAGLSLDAWVKPRVLPAGGGRIVDKTTPGASDGWLLDTYPGHSLRFIVGQTIVLAKDILPENEWSHVTAVADPTDGRVAIYLNGKIVASEKIDITNDAFVVSRAYALQRYIDACAGRGRYPIKFNGSLFTVAHEGKWGDADYRRWGPGYWWQNTRLPYLSMCTSGDFEMMQPLFRMYVEELTAVNEFRTERYTGHGGLFVPECMYFWGGTFAATYGWKPIEERGEDRLQESGWHKREWVSGPELAFMMLDYYDHTQDTEFLQKRLLPFATSVLQFFDEQFEVDDSGTLVMEPTQALETWWDTTNPMPEVAGLRAVTARLLALQHELVEPDDRTYWATVAAKLPELPIWKVEGKEMLAPAGRFEAKRNIENPELYAVFPFRLVSFEKPNVQLGIAALNHRSDRGAFGWRQDDLFMTHLGLANEAKDNIVSRARNKHFGSRFPAFWGPNYDWIPDQDHGGVLMRTLQTMLMQTEGRDIHLFSAWPREWNVEFKLHAPFRTTISGRLLNGEIVDLKVDPESRRKDVILHESY